MPPRFASPKSIVSHLQLWKGDHVADFGAGVGYFIIPLAESVGSEGKVYAVDIKKEHIRSAQKDAHALGHTHVHSIHCDLEKHNATGLRTGELDVVLIANTLSLFRDKDVVIKEASRVLRTGGKLCVIDTDNNFSTLLKNSGFSHWRDLPEIACGKYHLGILFTKD